MWKKYMPNVYDYESLYTDRFQLPRALSKYMINTKTKLSNPVVDVLAISAVVVMSPKIMHAVLVNRMRMIHQRTRN